jgi:hypothetical protein
VFVCGVTSDSTEKHDPRHWVPLRYAGILCSTHSRPCMQLGCSVHSHVILS